MPGANETERLGIRKFLDTDKFVTDTFNEVLDSIDGKVASISHESSLSHFEMWQPNKLYSKDDIVRTSFLKSNQYLLCINGGTTSEEEPQYDIGGTVFTDGTARWKISTLNGGESANSAGLTIWRQGEYYISSQMVLYNNCIYRCRLDHISTEFYEDYVTKWQLLYSNLMQFVSGNYYAQGTTVIYNNTVYRCLVGHRATSFNPSNWQRVCGMSITEWEEDYEYQQDDIILYNNVFYQAITGHTSDSTSFENDRDNWQILNFIPAEIPEYTNNTYFYANQLVTSNGYIYRCKIGHLSDGSSIKDDLLSNPSVPTSLHNWEYLGGITGWSASRWYLVGEFLLVDNILYRCNLTHREDNSFEHNRDKWDIIGKMGAYIEEWEHYKFYYADTLVKHNGIVYLVKEDYTEGANFTGRHLQEVSTFRVHDWRPDTHYNKDDVVTLFGYLYRCIETHTSIHVEVEGDDIVDEDEEPIDLATVTQAMRDIPAEDIDVVDIYRNTNLEAAFGEDKDRYWRPVKTQIPEWERGTSYVAGDIVVYQNNLYKALETHTSALRFITDADLDRWQVLGRATGILEEWTADKFYVPNDIFTFGGEMFRVIQNYQSPREFEIDNEKFERLVFLANIPDLRNERYYWLDNIVRYGGQFYRCTANHYYDSDTAIASELSSKWERLENHTPVDPVQLGKTYYTGDLILYNGVVYRVHANSDLGLQISMYSELEEDRDKFEHVYVNGIGEYSDTLSFKQGDTVIDGTNSFQNPMMITATQNITVNSGTSNLRRTALRDSPINSRMGNWEVVGPTFAKLVDGSYWFPRGTMLYNSDLDELFITQSAGVINNRLPGIEGKYFTHSKLVEWDSDRSDRIDSGTVIYADQIISVGGALYRSRSKHNVRYTYYSERFDEFLGDDHSWGRYYTRAFPWDEDEVGGTSNSDFYERLCAGLPEWESGKPYAKGEIVYHDGMLFYHNVAHKGLSIKHYEGGSKVETNGELGGTTATETSPYNDNWLILGYRHGILENFSTTNWYLPNSIVWMNGTLYRTTNSAPRLCTASDLQALVSSDFSELTQSLESLTQQVEDLEDDIEELRDDLGNLTGLDELKTKVQSLESTVAGHSNSIQSILQTINNLSNNLFDIKDWQPGTRYKLNEWVVADYCLYKCNSAHSSGTNFDSVEKSYFDLKVGGGGEGGNTIIVVSGTDGVVSGTLYMVGDVITIDGLFYRCINQYTSSGDFENEMDNWEEFDVKDEDALVSLQDEVSKLKLKIKALENFTAGNDYYIKQKFWNLKDERDFPQGLELDVNSTTYRFPKIEILQCMEFYTDNIEVQIDFDERESLDGYTINGVSTDDNDMLEIITTSDDGTVYNIVKHKDYTYNNVTTISGTYTDEEDNELSYTGKFGETDVIEFSDDETHFIGENLEVQIEGA